MEKKWKAERVVKDELAQRRLEGTTWERQRGLIGADGQV
jgi:hypothetical protein